MFNSRSMLIKFVVLAITIVALNPISAESETNATVSQGLKEEFEALLRKEAADLESNQRLETARTFVAREDGGYDVYAIIDTAHPEFLETSRYRISFQPDGKKWAVDNKTLEESSQLLVRDGIEARQFFRFKAFDLDKEGLSVSASNGTAVAYHVGGKVDRIILAADDLTYDYGPPEDLGDSHLLHRAITSTWKDDLVFASEVVEIKCDPSSCSDLLTSFSDLEETGPDSLVNPLADFYKSRTTDLREARTKDPFTDFRLPYRDNARWYQIRIKKTGVDHWIGLEYNSDSGFEVRFDVDGLGRLFGYAAEASRQSVDPIDIDRRDDDDGFLYQVTAITGEVKIALDGPEHLEADIVCTLKAKQTLDAIPFSIQAILVGAASESKGTFHVNALTDGEGRSLSWIRRGDTEGIILLPESLESGSEFIIHMKYQTEGNVHKITASYSYVSRSGWLPFVRYGDRIDTFDLTVKVPSRYRVLGVANNVSRERQDRVNVSRWVAKSPVQFPSIVFGVYESDKPKSKALRIDGTTIPVTVYIDKSSMAEWDIRSSQLRSPGSIAVNALNVYRELFGVDYPYSKLDLVNDPLVALGAQAPASIVYLGSAIFRSQEALASAYARDTTTLVEETIAHEVAHQWWGSLVSPANRRSYWFVESLAEYSSALFMEILASDGYRLPEKGRKAYLKMVGRWRTETLQSGLIGSVQGSSTLWTNGGYQAAVYSRGPYAFHMLRTTFGDEKFFSFLKTLARETSGKEIVTRDIQKIAERAFGGVGSDGKSFSVDLEWFFDQWIRSAGVPEFVFDYSTRPAEGGKFVVEGTIRQRVMAGKHDVEFRGVYYRGIVPVTVLGKDKQEYSAKIVVQGPETPFAFKVPSKPVDVALAKYGEILARKVLEP